MRLTFTTKQETESATATMETANATSEASKFLYYNEAVKINHTIWDRTNAGGTYYATRLSGTANEKFGLAKSLAVMPGDVVTAQVYAKYLGTSGGTANLSGFATALLSAFGLQAPAGGEVGTPSAAIQSYGNFIGGGGNAGNSSWPKGWLNILVFDKNYNLVDVAYEQLSSTYVQPVGNPTKQPHGLLSKTVTIKEPGYVYIYVSNEGTVQQEIYFDDLTLTHTKGAIVQMDDYYPFGLAFNSFERENATPQKFKYNGMEEAKELNINWLFPSKFRTYDPALGRFMQIDPVLKEHESPYAWNTNNPILYPDPTGADSTQRAQAVARAQEYVDKKPEGNQYLMGGKGAPGEKVDCSGLVSNCVKAGGEKDPNHGNESSGVLNIEKNTTEVEESEVVPGNIVTFRKSSGYAYHTGIVKSVERDEDGNITSVTYLHSSGGKVRWSSFAGQFLS